MDDNYEAVRLQIYAQPIDFANFFYPGNLPDHGNSANECAYAAIELMNTLCTAPEVPLEMRKLVFKRVVFACKKALYSYYHTGLLVEMDKEEELEQLKRD